MYLFRRRSATLSQSALDRLVARCTVLLLLMLAAGAVFVAPALAAGSVGGHVYDQTGQPIDLAQVGVYMSPDGVQGYGLVGMSPTDASGAWAVATTSAGHYRIQFSDSFARYVWEWWNDKLLWEQVDTLILGEDEVRTNINAVLTRTGRAAGIVRGAGGTPVAGIRIDVFRWSDAQQDWVGTAECYSGAGGAWEATDLTPGQFRFHFRDTRAVPVYADQFWDRQRFWDHAHSVNISPGANADFINAELVTGAFISGVVQNDLGAPVAGTRVVAHGLDPATGQWPGVREATTSAGGLFTLGPLTPGQYRIWYDGGGTCISEWWDDKANDWEADFVALIGGDHVVRNAVLSRAGSIAGHVVADGGTAPVEGVQVFVEHWAGWDFGGWQDRGPLATTDGDGAYTITGLVPGTYRVGFRDPDGEWAEEWYDDTIYDRAQDVLVTGELTTPVDASLARGGHIAGTVRDTEGNPLQGIDVSACRFMGEEAEEQWLWGWGLNVQTDETGFFSIDGLRPGTYQIELRDPNGVYAVQVYEDALNSGEGIDLVVEPDLTTWANPVLERGGRIYGQVVRADGRGLADVMVSFNCWTDDPEGGHWEWYTECYTDAQGDFSMAGLQARPTVVEFGDNAGQYLNEFYDNVRDWGAATPVDVIADASRNIGTIELTLGGHVAGTVTAAGGGGPLENVEVTIARWVEDWQDWDHFAGAQTGPDGTYDVAGLPAGTYRVLFRDPNGTYVTEWFENAPGPWEGQGVVVTEGGTTQVDAALDLGAAISGHIRDGSGNPIQGIRATLFYLEPGEQEWTQFGDYDDVVSDADGYYRFQALPSRTYQLRLENDSNAAMWGTEVFDGALVVGTGTDLSPAPGEELTVDPVLDPGGRLAGRLCDDLTLEPNGFAYSQDCHVWAWVPDAGLPGGGSWQRYYSLWSQYEPAGVLAGSDLAPGEYRLSFGDWLGSYLEEWWQDQPDLEHSTPVTIKAGQTTDLGDVFLTRSAMIHGTVTGPDGEPLGGVHVSALEFLDGEWREVSGFDSWSDGTYHIGNLGGGTYRVEFDGRDLGLTREFWSDQASALGAFDVVVGVREDAWGIDAQLGATGALEGTVLGAGGDPVPDVTVRIAVWDVNAGRYVQLDEERSEVLVDGNGAWRLADVSPGTYRVWSSPSDNDYGEGVVEGVVVKAGETTRVDIVPPRAGSVAGLVTAIGGAPVDNAFVMLLKYSPEDLTWWGTGIETYSKADGTYTMPNVTPGTYRIVFGPPEGSGLVEEFWDNRATVGIAHDLTVAVDEDITDIDAVLGPAADAAPPSNPKVSGGDDAWHSTPVRLDFSATDDLSGVAEYEYVVDGAPWADGDHVVIPSPAGHSNDGVHDVYVRAIDHVGHVSNTVHVQVKIDTTGPVVSGDPPATWVQGPVTVHLGAFDTGCGVVDHLEYAPAQSGPWQTGSSFVVNTGRRGSGSGERTTWVRGIDGLGNASDPAPIVVSIDGRPPTTCHDSDGLVHDSDVTVHLSAVDPLSGPGWTCFSVDGGAWMIGDTVVVPALSSGANDGVHTIWFYSVDAAGNVEPTIRSCRVVIDVPGAP